MSSYFLLSSSYCPSLEFAMIDFSLSLMTELCNKDNEKSIIANSSEGQYEELKRK
jgi:hypothetical protein